MTHDHDLDRALYPATADNTITPDRDGHEWFVEPQYGHLPRHKSPLMADVAGADTSNWSADPRPPVTAWEGADMDAHWLDGETWRHCVTGEIWADFDRSMTRMQQEHDEGRVGDVPIIPDQPVNLLDAVNQFRAEALAYPISQATVTDFLCALITASTSLDTVREGSDQLEAAE